MEILTGNELLSGATIYLDGAGNWQMDINSARLFAKGEVEARDAAIAGGNATGRIVSLEIETVQFVDGKVIADRLRERIRANGPTAPYGPERQDLGDNYVSL